jgi:hypothetical protein
LRIHQLSIKLINVGRLGDVLDNDGTLVPLVVDGCLDMAMMVLMMVRLSGNAGDESCCEGEFDDSLHCDQ